MFGLLVIIYLGITVCFWRKMFSLSLSSFLVSGSHLLLSMAEPAELLLIKDQYELAFHALSRGLTAEEAGKRVEAVKYYAKGRQHLIQGLEVPTWGQKRVGAGWETARQLQQKMRGTLGTVTAHLSDLQTSGVTTGDQRGHLLMNLPPKLYPDITLNSQPPHSSLHHLYPSIPPTNKSTNPTRTTAPAPHRQPLRAAASGTIAMATPREQPPAYTLQPTIGHRSLAYGPAGGSRPSGVAQEGSELIFIPSGVQLFFVAPNGEVSSLSHPGFLRIITYTRQKNSRPSASLQVSEQVYVMISTV